MAAKRPPATLSRRGRAFWRQTLAVYDLSDPEFEVLAEVCQTLDEITSMQEALSTGDMVVAGSAGQPRPNPLVGELRSHRLALSKLIAALDLPTEDGGQVLPSPQSLRGRRAAESRWARTAAVRASRRSHGGAA